MSAEVSIRRATMEDAVPVARLHAESWRRWYRGSYSDAYLDGDLDADRRAVWTERLAAPANSRITLIGERQGALIGFIHVDLDADPHWGALIDNLHVTYRSQDSGVGTRLLAAAARLVIEARPGHRMYLWVQENNTHAQAFYLGRGARPVGRDPSLPPRGEERNLAGVPYKLRVVWQDVAALALSDRAHPARPEEGNLLRVQAAYDTVAHEYDRQIGEELEHKPLDRALLTAFLELVPDGLVADIGCGPGHITRFARTRRSAVLGIDLSPEMVRIARRHDPNGGYLTASMLDLPIADRLLAGVMAVYSIIHLGDEQRAAAIEEFGRTLRVGGWLYLAFHVESDETPMGGVKHLTDWFGKTVVLESHFLDPAKVTADLVSSGFTVKVRAMREADPEVEFPSRRCYLLAQLDGHPSRSPERC